MNNLTCDILIYFNPSPVRTSCRVVVHNFNISKDLVFEFYNELSRCFNSEDYWNDSKHVKITKQNDSSINFIFSPWFFENNPFVTYRLLAEIFDSDNSGELLLNARSESEVINKLVKILSSRLEVKSCKVIL